MLRIIAFLMLCSPVYGQISVPESTGPNEPITARLELSVDENSEATVNWSADPKSKFIPAAERFSLHIWAGSGEHWLKAAATIVKFEKRQVFVPDPQDPTNISKAKLETLKVFVSSEVREFPVKPFRVTDAPRPPPDPTPHPDPPKPDPPIPDPPTPGKISVLIVEDVSARSNLPRPQLLAMLGHNVKTYLDSHCRMGPDGKTPEWRRWHYEDDASHESKVWQDAIAQFRAIDADPNKAGIQMPALPYILISNGVTGTAGPLPTTEADLLALLRKWGGQ